MDGLKEVGEDVVEEGMDDVRDVKEEQEEKEVENVSPSSSWVRRMCSFTSLSSRVFLWGAAAVTVVATAVVVASIAHSGRSQSSSTVSTSCCRK